MPRYRTRHSEKTPRLDHGLHLSLAAVLFFAAAVGVCGEGPTPDPVKDNAAFEQAAAGQWREVFADPGNGDWEQRWFLDGEVGTVKTGPLGMELTAGPEYRNDAHHMVLWTRDCFEGDLKIEYEYTRLDEEPRCVTIIYIQATGSGKGPYHEDIAKWNELRKVPSMATYFDHMHTYHLSYAAFPDTTDATSYVRARRYMPEETGLKGTELAPDYFPEGLFKTGVPHKITIVKKARDLFMRIENAEQTLDCHMANPDLPPITAGRIGLRHMFTRSARYRNFRISRPAVPGDGKPASTSSKPLPQQQVLQRPHHHDRRPGPAGSGFLSTARIGALRFPSPPLCH